jgi:hypothetical protein
VALLHRTSLHAYEGKILAFAWPWFFLGLRGCSEAGSPLDTRACAERMKVTDAP